MKLKSLISFILILALFSCKKNDTEYNYAHHIFSDPGCSLCGFADSLTGTYKGIAQGAGVPDVYSGYFLSADSLTMTVSQVFLNQSAYEDSVYMYFAVSFRYHSQSTVKWDTVQIVDTSGITQHEEYLSFVSVNNGNYFANQNYLKITPSFIKLRVIGPSGPGGGYGVPYHISTLYKQ